MPPFAFSQMITVRNWMHDNGLLRPHLRLSTLWRLFITRGGER